MKPRSGPVLALLFGAAGWGLVWYPYRLLEAAGVSGVVASFASYGLPLAVALALVRSPWRELRRGGWPVLVLSFAAAWTNIGYVLAVIGGEIMRVLLLFYLAPLWTVLLSRTFLGERPGIPGALVIVLSLSGAIIMLKPPGAGLPLPANGAEWIALSSGFMFALSNVMSRFATHVGTAAKSLSIWLGVSLIAAVWIMIDPGQLAFVARATPVTWGLLAFVGCFIGIVTLSVQYGLSHVAANRAIVLFMFELVVAAVSAYVLVGETLSAREWLGGALIVAATLFSSQLEKPHED